MAIYTGMDYARGITFRNSAGTPVDIDGWTLELRVRAVPLGGEVFTLTVGNGGLIPGSTAGKLTISMSAARTALLLPGTAELIMVRTDGGKVERIFGARVKVRAG